MLLVFFFYRNILLCDCLTLPLLQSCSVCFSPFAACSYNGIFLCSFYVRGIQFLHPGGTCLFSQTALQYFETIREVEYAAYPTKGWSLYPLSSFRELRYLLSPKTASSGGISLFYLSSIPKLASKVMLTNFGLDMFKLPATLKKDGPQIFYS